MPANHFQAMQRVLGREREELITQLRAEGHTFAEIGRRLDISRELAGRIWRRAVSRAPIANVREWRESELELIGTAIRELFEIARNPNAAFKERVAAYDSICRWDERRAKAIGSDAIVKREVTVLTEDTIGAAIRKLQGDMLLQAKEAGVEMPPLQSRRELTA